MVEDIGFENRDLNGGPRDIHLNKKRERKNKFLILIVVLVVVAAGVTLFYFFGRGTALFRGADHDEIVVADLTENLANLQSFSYEADVRVHGQVSIFVPADELIIQVSGEASLLEDGRLAERSDFDVRSGEGNEFGVSGEVMARGDRIYLRLDDFVYGDQNVFRVVTGEWFWFENEAEEVDEGEEEEIRNTIFAADLFDVEEVLADEEAEGMEMSHYVVRFDEEELADLVITFKGLEGGEAELTSDEREMVEKLAEVPIEIWIGKRDLQLYRMRATFSDIQKAGVDVEVDVRFADHNERFDFEEPEGAEKARDDFSNFVEIEGLNSSEAEFSPSIFESLLEAE